MTRFALFAAVMFVAALATVTLIEEPAPQKSCRVVTQFDQETQELSIRYEHFKATLNGALNDLARNKGRLHDAVYGVRDASYVYCPIYVDRLQTAERGATPEERVARNLIGHLRDMEDADPRLAGRTAALVSELEALLSHLDNAGCQNSY